MPQKIIIDTDPGVDDAMAIFFALRSPELEVIGLTTIFGNVHTSLATVNALRLLDIADRPDIPVAKGADNPMAVPYGGPVAFVHGDDGQGNVNLPPSPRTAVDQTAAQFIVEQVMSQPGEVTLVPVGPLTNIALALRLEPRIAQHVKQVVLMGGNAVVPGNATPCAEANIHNDPEAADVVFSAPWPVVMVGLDVTHKVYMSGAHVEEYALMDNPMAQHVYRILPHYRAYFNRGYGIDGIFVHDSSAVAYLLDPTLFGVIEREVCVDCTHDIGRGKTWPALGERTEPPWEGRPKVTICTEVDSERLVELELSRMRG
ncbi:MAG TPA: nucleoside hydrolase [Candidatus Limnocylindrales bacterium]|nr:nucleoside hydrolase [Candidatus Limnocylindrales bacterium]